MKLYTKNIKRKITDIFKEFKDDMVTLPGELQENTNKQLNQVNSVQKNRTQQKDRN